MSTLTCPNCKHRRFDDNCFGCDPVDFKCCLCHTDLSLSHGGHHRPPSRASSISSVGSVDSGVSVPPGKKKRKWPDGVLASVEFDIDTERGYTLGGKSSKRRKRSTISQSCSQKAPTIGEQYGAIEPRLNVDLRTLIFLRWISGSENPTVSDNRYANFLSRTFKPSACLWFDRWPSTDANLGNRYKFIGTASPHWETLRLRGRTKPFPATVFRDVDHVGLFECSALELQWAGSKLRHYYIERFDRSHIYDAGQRVMLPGFRLVECGRSFSAPPESNAYAGGRLV